MKRVIMAGALFVVGCGGKPAPETIPTTYRLIAGVSMGGFGSSIIGLSHPELFDGVAPMGGPFDAAYLLRMLDNYLLGGFCSRQQLETILAENPGNPNALNDPNLVGWCMAPRAAEVTYEHSQSYSHWHFTTNGGTVNRNFYLNTAFYDLGLALGNPLYYNPASPMAPPGIDPDMIKNPPPDICSNPIVLKNFYNAEYNPDAKYNAVSFCDGQAEPIYVCATTHRVVDFCANGAVVVPQAQEAAYAQTFCGTEQVVAASKTVEVDAYYAWEGYYDPCRVHTVSNPAGLALDINGNGRRDFGEPILNNSHERFQDVGTDGCPDPLEDGHGGCVVDPAQSPYAHGVPDPNGDDYDAVLNPSGTEDNWVYDVGEPFEDYGLDGVPNTGDYGEGNGVYDESPNRLNFLKQDPRTNYRKLTPAQKAALDIYVDGGIRDVFNFGVTAGQFFGAVRGAFPESVLLRDFAQFAPATWTDSTYDGTKIFWDRMPRNAGINYGDSDATVAEIQAGDGDHVGTTFEALERFLNITSWASSRWTIPDASPGTPCKASSDCFSGATCASGACLSDPSVRILSKTFFSKSLNANQDYGIYLPPGYDDPANTEVRYPVLYLLHGVGQVPSGPGGFNLVSEIMFEPYMSDPTAKIRKYLVVFPDGRCCFNGPNGARACTEADANGVPYSNQAGWVRECNSGTFYVNRQGFTPTDNTPYEDAMLDLIEYVDQNYRTLAPANVIQR
jgi:hypothetical protein